MMWCNRDDGGLQLVAPSKAPRRSGALLQGPLGSAIDATDVS